MTSAISNNDVDGLMDRMKQLMDTEPGVAGSLDLAFESAVKHIPAYIKIVKGHIDQLAKVLELETHDNRNLDSVGLAEPVTQLIQLFRELDEADLQLLEALSFEARNWQEEVESPAMLEKEMTAEKA